MKAVPRYIMATIAAAIGPAGVAYHTHHTSMAYHKAIHSAVHPAIFHIERPEASIRALSISMGTIPMRSHTEPRPIHAADMSTALAAQSRNPFFIL